MITIPTLELVGASRDAILFTAPEKDFPELARIRYQWDGETLHITATNILTGCHATWNPDADDYDGPDNWPNTRWGGADNPWTVVIGVDAAKHLVASLNVNAKLGRCPLTVECDQAHLVVKRSRDTGLSAVTNRYQGSLEQFPDVAARIAAVGNPKPVDRVAFDWPGSNALTKVAKRRGAPIEMLPCEDGIGVGVGEAFTAFVQHAGGGW